MTVQRNRREHVDRTPVPAVPVGAALLDVASLVLVGLALGVLVAGVGGHLRAFGLALSLHSWQRPLAWAVVAVTVRHVFVPRPSLTVRLVDGLTAGRRAMSSSAWRAALSAAVGPVVASRTVVYTVGLVAIVTIGLSPDSSFIPAGRFLDMLSRWDATWYTAIAEKGYSWNGNPRFENPVVFFPALPLLMRAGAWLTGVHVTYVGFVISMIAFTGAMAYVYRIASEQLRLESPAIVLSFIAWYPFSVFFGAVYTESLFLLAIAGAFYHARAEQRLQTAAWGLLASLVKTNGFLITIPLAVMFALRLARAARERPGFPTARAAVLDALVIAAPLAGVAAYSLYVWTLTGDPLAWLHAQQAWGRELRGPVALLAEGSQRLTRGLVEAMVVAPFDVLNAFAAIFALACVVPIYFRLGAPYALLVVVMVLPPLLAGGTTSMGRFTSCVFPLFLWLGAVVPVSARPGICAAFASGQALAATLFFTWRPLY